MRIIEKELSAPYNASHLLPVHNGDGSTYTIESIESIFKIGAMPAQANYTVHDIAAHVLVDNRQINIDDVLSFQQTAYTTGAERMLQLEIPCLVFCNGKYLLQIDRNHHLCVYVLFKQVHFSSHLFLYSSQIERIGLDHPEAIDACVRDPHVIQATPVRPIGFRPSLLSFISSANIPSDMPVSIIQQYGRMLNDRDATVRRNSWIQQYKAFWTHATYSGGEKRRVPLTINELYNWVRTTQQGRHEGLGGLTGPTCFGKWLAAARGVGDGAARILTAAAIRASNPVVISMNVIQVRLTFTYHSLTLP